MLVVAAVPEELGELGGVAVGVGPVRAAAGTARALAVQSPGFVVLVGTAGAYPGGPEVGSVVAGATLGLETGVAGYGLGYVPVPPPPLHTDEALRAAAGVEAADVLTVFAITTDPALAASHGGRWRVEHMEAYGVAWAAAEAGVPLLVLLGITNDVGPSAHAQWRAQRASVERAVREVCRRVIDDRRA